MKRAIVTGGAGLIGSEICRRLLAEGWQVASFDVHKGQGDAVDIQCDIGSEAAVDAAFSQLGWDQVDLLVNNGGRTPSINMELAQATLKDAEISDLKRDAKGTEAAQVATDTHRDRVEFVIRDYRETPSAPTSVKCMEDPAVRAAMAYGDSVRAAQLNSAAAGPPAGPVHP